MHLTENSQNHGYQDIKLLPRAACVRIRAEDLLKKQMYKKSDKQSRCLKSLCFHCKDK